MLMASTILLNRLRRADTVPKASVARGYQQAKAVALALKECAVASPGMDDTERASNLYHAVIAFLSFHFDDISAAPFSDATVKDVSTRLCSLSSCSVSAILIRSCNSACIGCCAVARGALSLPMCLWS